MSFLRPVYISDGCDALVVLDQTFLPGEVKYIALHSIAEIYEAIKSLRVRGAPAIGIAAAYGVTVAALRRSGYTYTDFLSAFLNDKEKLASSRPTAVNLFWALKRMERSVRENAHLPVEKICELMLKEANAIYDEDVENCRKIGENGITLLKNGDGILTHCNAGALATSMYGTALSPIYIGKERGYDFRVYVDETRPLLQGARLTSFELMEAGIDTTLICDSAASHLMSTGAVNAVLVGADRIALNGDTANKIGTCAVSIIAKYYGIPFYVCAPLSTFDISCKSGEDITIEERPSDEITDMWYNKRMAPDNIKTLNPAFDITSGKNISAIITERGIIFPPFYSSISDMFKSI